MLKMKIFILRSLFIGGVILASILLVRAFDSRNLPDLQPWHSIVLNSEFTESKSDQIDSLSVYLELEERVFQELDKSIYKNIGPEKQFLLSRYTSKSPVNPEDAWPWDDSQWVAPCNMERLEGSHISWCKTRTRKGAGSTAFLYRRLF